MKYIKTYDKKIAIPDIVLYKCDDFEIVIYSSNGSFTYASRIRACSAIMGMAILISEKSKYLSDQKLRDVIIPQTNKIKEIEYLDLDKIKLDNIKKYKTGPIKYFIEQDIPKIDIPNEVFIELTLEYNQKIMIAVANSKTLGDIIDSFEIIYNDILIETELRIGTNKYNL